MACTCALMYGQGLGLGLGLGYGYDPISVADVQADAAPENIAAEAKVGGADEDVREVMRELSPEKRNMILRRRGVRVADWEAKEKRIDSSVWDTLRRKGAPAL